MGVYIVNILYNAYMCYFIRCFCFILNVLNLFLGVFVIWVNVLNNVAVGVNCSKIGRYDGVKSDKNLSMDSCINQVVILIHSIYFLTIRVYFTVDR